MQFEKFNIAQTVECLDAKKKRIKVRKPDIDTINLVSVVIGLVRTLLRETEVLRLDVSQLGQLDTQLAQVEFGNGLVQDFRQNVNVHAERTSLLEFDVLLSKLLVVSFE